MTVLLAVVLLPAATTGCGALSPEPDDARPGPPGHAAVITVPEDAPTIQRAVDAAVPGDLVLISAGTYRESVTVSTPRIVLRGADRHAVVIDGQSRRKSGITVTAAEVAVENLTLRHHRADGLVFKGTSAAPLQGYRASYLTVADNQRHGIHARYAVRGLVEHSHLSGHGDSGLHIAHCLRCQSLVRELRSSRSAVEGDGEGAGTDGGAAAHTDIRLTDAEGVRVEEPGPDAAERDDDRRGSGVAAGQPQRPGGATGPPEPAVARPV